MTIPQECIEDMVESMNSKMKIYSRIYKQKAIIDSDEAKLNFE